MITIYALKCLPTQKAYIGSTKGKLSKRMREHRCLLNKGQHKTIEMQADWFKYGSENFICLELEQVADDMEARRNAEVGWMETHKNQGQLYNEHIVSMMPTREAIMQGVANAHNEPGNRWTKEANLKRSLAQKGKPKGHGAKISATKRARQAMR